MLICPSLLFLSIQPEVRVQQRSYNSPVVLASAHHRRYFDFYLGTVVVGQDGDRLIVQSTQ